MSGHYFTDQKLTKELFLGLPKGTLHVITNSNSTRVLLIGENTPTGDDTANWDMLISSLASESSGDDDFKISCFKNWDELEKWHKSKNFEKNYGG